MDDDEINKKLELAFVRAITSFDEEMKEHTNMANMVYHCSPHHDCRKRGQNTYPWARSVLLGDPIQKKDCSRYMDSFKSVR